MRGRPTFRYWSAQKMLAGVTRTPRNGSERYTAEPVCRQLYSRSHTGMAAPVATGAPPPLLRPGELPVLSANTSAPPALPRKALAGPTSGLSQRRPARSGARRTLGVAVPQGGGSEGAPQAGVPRPLPGTAVLERSPRGPTGRLPRCCPGTGRQQRDAQRTGRQAGERWPGGAAGAPGRRARPAAASPPADDGGGKGQPRLPPTLPGPEASAQPGLLSPPRRPRWVRQAGCRPPTDGGAVQASQASE